MEMYNVIHAVGCGDCIYSDNHEVKEVQELATYCKPIVEWLRKRKYKTLTKVIIDKFGAEFVVGEMHVPFAEDSEP